MKRLYSKTSFTTLLFLGVVYVSFTTALITQDGKTDQQKDTVYTYRKNILPLLQTNCNPCHFTGGKVYKKLPFDDYKTVATLGKKLNTRLKQKEQQAIVNGWINSGATDRIR